MPSQTRSAPADSPAPGVIPDPAGSAAPLARVRDVTSAPTTGTEAGAGEETRGGRFRRVARRTRLHGYAIAAVALVAYLIALAVSNTAHVKVSWVFGASHVALVWLVLFTAILGWLLGLATSARFQWRTRAPRRQGGQSS
ncbi:MAG TPA: LapA family protein [Solirubrobacteraceae bacterium]|jgi:uncharacterized integral membrane protein